MVARPDNVMLDLDRILDGIDDGKIAVAPAPVAAAPPPAAPAVIAVPLEEKAPAEPVTEAVKPVEYRELKQIRSGKFPWGHGHEVHLKDGGVVRFPNDQYDEFARRIRRGRLYEK